MSTVGMPTVDRDEHNILDGPEQILGQKVHNASHNEQNQRVLDSLESNLGYKYVAVPKDPALHGRPKNVVVTKNPNSRYGFETTDDNNIEICNDSDENLGQSRGNISKEVVRQSKNISEQNLYDNDKTCQLKEISKQNLSECPEGCPCRRDIRIQVAFVDSDSDSNCSNLGLPVRVESRASRENSYWHSFVRSCFPCFTSEMVNHLFGSCLPQPIGRGDREATPEIEHTDYNNVRIVSNRSNLEHDFMFIGSNTQVRETQPQLSTFANQPSNYV